MSGRDQVGSKDERSGVNVERCTECRGVFLDAGELERVMEAESGFNQRRGWARQDDRMPPAYDDEREHRRPRRRPGGFLGELFGGDDD